MATILHITFLISLTVALAYCGTIPNEEDSERVHTHVK